MRQHLGRLTVAKHRQRCAGILLGLGCTVFVCLLALAACAGPIPASMPKTTVPPTPKSTPTVAKQTPIPEPTPYLVTILQDNLTLDPYNEQEFERRYIDNWPPKVLPFNDCGLYISKPFYMREGEKGVITITSDLIISLEWQGEEYPGGINVSIDTPGGNRDELDYSEFNLHRTGNGWRAIIKYECYKSGNYYISITNETSDTRYSSVPVTATCQYSLTVE